MSLKTRNNLKILRNLRSIPGKRTWSSEGKNATRSTIAIGLSTYFRRFFELEALAPIFCFDSTQDHSLIKYSVAKTSVELTSINKKSSRYCLSNSSIDSRTMQTTFKRIRDTMKIEKALHKGSFGSDISRISWTLALKTKSISKVLHGLSLLNLDQESISISIRLFCTLPSGVSFEATG